MAEVQEWVKVVVEERRALEGQLPAQKMAEACGAVGTPNRVIETQTGGRACAGSVDEKPSDAEEREREREAKWKC